MAYYADMSAGANGKHLRIARPLLAVQVKFPVASRATSYRSMR
jgi:hypothetical protein